GYKIALDNLDAIIKIIRGSASRQEAKDNLLEVQFKLVDKLLQARIGGTEGRLTSRQADAILELQLYRLTRLSSEEILKELEEIRQKISEYESILASDKKLRGVIVRELEEVRKDFGDERKTQIVDESVEITLEDL